MCYYSEKKMGLPRAIQAHAANQLEEAEIHYRRTYSQGITNEIFYQNFGALLKKLGKTDESALLFEEGIKLYPKHAGIKRNYANQLRNVQPTYAVELYLDAIHLLLSNSDELEMLSNCFDDLVDLFRQLRLFHWARSLIKISLRIQTVSPLILKNLLLILDELDVSSGSKTTVLAAINSELNVANLKDAVSLDFALAEHYLHSSHHERSLYHFEKALNRVQSSPHINVDDGPELQKVIDTNSWNYACTLLPLNQLERGWSLYDHGLTTHADGQQKWQRALVKPFTATQLKIWRGQNDPAHRLLLLEEQGIGDTMMFLSLIPKLLSETKHLGILLSPRLEPIYKLSFSKDISDRKITIYNQNDLAENRLNPTDFDSQIPLGSICQHRFIDINSYSPRVPVLVADETRSTEMRQDYLKDRDTVKCLVGVSWRGGGRGKRIKQKSLNVELFGQLMRKHPHIRFIDLQYGETADQVKSWRDSGIDIIHDPRINPLKDMYSWLSQVNVCDAVISVANTTIHGAGGLNIPTQCLLSIHSDWRWLADSQVSRSYWYPSVGIAREQKNVPDPWSNALHLVSEWLSNQCPMPSGPIQ
ncbi:hypothetical protein OAI49_00655 [Synechococcus sp. AH-558-M21]|nr:hypothetical protein [Synechococcus sp. AH-558-M21]